MKEYISRIQAQRALGLNKDLMMRLLRTGEIESARKENGGWLVSIESLEDYRKKRKESVATVADLQRLVNAYKEENRKLKKLLEENGINYEGTACDGIEKKPDISIIDLYLPKRAVYALDAHGVHSLEQLRNMTINELKSLDGIGKKTAALIRSRLLSFGIEPIDY